MNQQEKESAPAFMSNRCPLCTVPVKQISFKPFIESLTLHVVGEHKRTIEEANDLISRYCP